MKDSHVADANQDNLTPACQNPLTLTAGHLAPLLRLSDDILLDICNAVKVGKPVGDGTNDSDMTSLKALSQCNRRFRRFLLPEVLRSVSIYHPGSWNNANEQLQGLLSCEYVKHRTRRFGLDLRDGQVEDYSSTDTMTMPAWFRQDLGDVLRGMAKLEHLTLHVMEEL